MERITTELRSPSNSRSMTVKRMNDRLTRFDRLPYMFNRWNDSISIGVFATEDEVKDVAFDILTYKTDRSVVYTIYVQKRITNANIPYYLNRDGVRYEYQEGLYPVNLLRDLSIESVTTSHFMVIDADVFLSSTILSSIDRYKNMLNNHKNVMVIPLFQYTDTNYWQRCYRDGMCEYAYERE